MGVCGFDSPESVSPSQNFAKTSQALTHVGAVYCYSVLVGTFTRSSSAVKPRGSSDVITISSKNIPSKLKFIPEQPTTCVSGRNKFDLIFSCH